MAASAGTIEIVHSAFRSVVSGERLAYLSAPITSGRRAIDAAVAGVSKGEVIRENIAVGTRLAREIARTQGKTIVAPTIFDGKPQGWTQGDYVAMWLGMIEENIGDVYMSPDWAFSNGCAEEYLKAVNMAHGFGVRSDIVTRHPDGRLLLLHEGLAAISEALHVMQERGIKSETIASVFVGLYSAHVAWRTPDLMHDLPTDFNRYVVHHTDGEKVDALVRELAPLLRRCYDWQGEVRVQLTSGAIRTINAWPEGVVLGAVDPEQEVE